MQLEETSEILPSALLAYKLISLDSSSKTKCPNHSGSTHANKPVDSFIVIAQRNAAMISKAAPK